MPKHRQQNKAHQTNREETSISVGPETSNQMQEQMDASELQTHDGFTPSYEDVQRRAYQIHEEKGGSDFENWLEAESVLKEEHRYVEH